MGSSQLIVFGFVLACVRLSDARFLGERAPTNWGVEVQKPAEVEAEPAAEPERGHSRESAQRAGRLQTKHIQAEVEPLAWKFPEDPVDPVNEPPVEFDPRRPETTNRVAVRCGERRIQVEVHQDLLGLNRLSKPEEITLGGCSATEVDDSSHVLIFESELHGCGSALTMSEDTFIYTFTLVYNPEVSGRSHITRSQNAVIGVECHYPRRRSASSHLQRPPWVSSEGTAEEQPHFSLQLMSDDWKSERSSGKYAPRDVIRVQASVMHSGPAPLRVLVDHCVASRRPESTSELRHVFIKNHGCLGDRGTSLRSRFMSQSQPEKLQFQVAAFDFRQLKTMYFTCRLKAIPASLMESDGNKLCSFNKWWRSVSGQDQFCACCDSSCEVDADTEGLWKAEVTLGPVVVEQEHFPFSVKQ